MYSAFLPCSSNKYITQVIHYKFTFCITFRLIIFTGWLMILSTTIVLRKQEKTIHSRYYNNNNIKIKILLEFPFRKQISSHGKKNKKPHYSKMYIIHHFCASPAGLDHQPHNGKGIQTELSLDKATKIKSLHVSILHRCYLGCFISSYPKTNNNNARMKKKLCIKNVYSIKHKLYKK